MKIISLIFYQYKKSAKMHALLFLGNVQRAVMILLASIFIILPIDACADSDVLSSVKAAEAELEVSNYQHKQAMLLYYQGVYRFQEIASYAGLILVYIVVVSGVLFSAVQIRHGTRPNNFAGKSGATGGKDTLTMGMSGIKITSSVTGVLILVVSLAFFLSLYN